MKGAAISRVGTGNARGHRSAVSLANFEPVLKQVGNPGSGI